MQHSGPNNECPVCNRNRKDFCRWTDNRIYCYRGQSYGPPDIAIGQTIDIDGVKWAYVKDNAGFSGNSAMFIPDDESSKPDHNITPSAAIRKAVDTMYAKDRFERDVELAEYSLTQIENMEDFETMPPDRIRESLEICRDAFLLHKDLITKSRRLRRHLPTGPVVEALQAGMKAIGYQGATLRRFWFDTLLDPGGGRGHQLAQQLRQEVQP